MTRPRHCPPLGRHKGTGQAYVAFRVNGRRVWVWFGPWGSVASRIRYSEFNAQWPAALANPPPERPHTPRVAEIGGQPVRLAKAARTAGLRPGTVRYRIDVLGWSPERAVSTPARPVRA